MNERDDDDDENDQDRDAYQPLDHGTPLRALRDSIFICGRTPPGDIRRRLRWCRVGTPKRRPVSSRTISADMRPRGSAERVEGGPAPPRHWTITDWPLRPRPCPVRRRCDFCWSTTREIRHEVVASRAQRAALADPPGPSLSKARRRYTRWRKNDMGFSEVGVSSVLSVQLT